MVITDLPGVGESRDRDAEYEALYRDILLELDLVLWLIKADDRALSVDEYFWRHILHRGHQRVLFVVMQADKTEPCHEWDMAGIRPRKRLKYAGDGGNSGGLLSFTSAHTDAWRQQGYEDTMLAMEHIRKPLAARQALTRSEAVLQKSLDITEEADLALRNAMARIK